MTLMDQSALLDLAEALTRADDGSMMRLLLQSALQALIVPRKREVPPAQADAHVGADRHERSEVPYDHAQRHP